MYHLQRNEMYRLGDNAQKSYVVHRRLTKHLGIVHNLSSAFIYFNILCDSSVCRIIFCNVIHRRW